MQKKIYYKDFYNEWEVSILEPTQDNLAYIKKHFALNGQASIQTVPK